MQRRRSARRRSRREIAVRSLFALAVLGGGYIAVTQSLALSLGRRAPERAYALSPSDGRLAARLSEKLSGPYATAADRSRADRLARQALNRDATAVPAAATLGINAQIRGDTAAARRLFGFAQKLSRRDLRTQLWAIEDAVARDDIAGALRQYDIALRTSRVAPDLLFPILASAVADPAIRIALTRTLAANPNWGEPFIEYVVDRGTDPRSIADLLVGLQRTSLEVPDRSRATLVDKLVAADMIVQGWDYYASVHPGVRRDQSRDPRLASGAERPTQFDWTGVNDTGVSTSLQPDEGGFDFSLSNGTGGPLLHQLQLLPPGAYVLEGRASDLKHSEDAAPYWSLLCRDGRELTRVPVSAANNGQFRASFTVPAGCPVQTLFLVARPSDDPTGQTGRIDRAQIRPGQ